MTVVGYVVNMNRTKLLMLYNSALERWVTTAHTSASNEPPSHNSLQRRIAEITGLVARPVAAYKQADSASQAFMLEAEEDDTAKYELEERFDAQWLTREQILACICIDPSVKVFARMHLTGIQ